jgi:hypothetical protein
MMWVEYLSKQRSQNTPGIRRLLGKELSSLDRVSLQLRQSLENLDLFSSSIHQIDKVYVHSLNGLLSGSMVNLGFTRIHKGITYAPTSFETVW